MPTRGRFVITEHNDTLDIHQFHLYFIYFLTPSIKGWGYIVIP